MSTRVRPSRAKKQPGVEPRAFAGFGESKLHCAPEGTFDDDKTRDWSKLTFKGEPIPEHFRSLFSYAMTDQGMAETEAAIEARGGRAVTEFARDVQDKLVDKFGDDLLSERSRLIHTQDPLAVVMNRHLPKGMRGRWLSKRKTGEAGLIRGVVEYEPVRVPDPDHPGAMMNVTLGGMTLGAIPEDLAREAERHYQSLTEEVKSSAAEAIREHNDKHGGDQLTAAATRRGKLESIQGEEVDDTPRAVADLERELNSVGS